MSVYVYSTANHTKALAVFSTRNEAQEWISVNDTIGDLYIDGTDDEVTKVAKSFTVTHTLYEFNGQMPTGKTVDMTYGREINAIGAANSVTSILAMIEDNNDDHTRWQTKSKSITITINY